MKKEWGGREFLETLLWSVSSSIPQVNERLWSPILQLNLRLLMRQFTVGSPTGWSNFYLRSIAGNERLWPTPVGRMSKKWLQRDIACILWCCRDKCMWVFPVDWIWAKCKIEYQLGIFYDSVKEQIISEETDISKESIQFPDFRGRDNDNQWAGIPPASREIQMKVLQWWESPKNPWNHCYILNW